MGIIQPLILVTLIKTVGSVTRTGFLLQWERVQLTLYLLKKSKHIYVKKFKRYLRDVLQKYKILGVQL